MARLWGKGIGALTVVLMVLKMGLGVDRGRAASGGASGFCWAVCFEVGAAGGPDVSQLVVGEFPGGSSTGVGWCHRGLSMSTVGVAGRLVVAVRLAGGLLLDVVGLGAGRVSFKVSRLGIGVSSSGLASSSVGVDLLLSTSIGGSLGASSSSSCSMLGVGDAMESERSLRHSGVGDLGGIQGGCPRDLPGVPWPVWRCEETNWSSGSSHSSLSSVLVELGGG